MEKCCIAEQGTDNAPTVCNTIGVQQQHRLCKHPFSVTLYIHYLSCVWFTGQAAITALTDWYLIRRRNVFTARYDLKLQLLFGIIFSLTG